MIHPPAILAFKVHAHLTPTQRAWQRTLVFLALGIVVVVMGAEDERVFDLPLEAEGTAGCVLRSSKVEGRRGWWLGVVRPVKKK